jgi:Domain of unknown function (DUF4375)
MKISRDYVARLLAANADEATEALAQLSTCWAARARFTESGKLNGLSPSEMAAHLALWYSAEVGNGGHTQYFMNPIGSFAHETFASLETLNLKHAATILRSALEVFPDREASKDQELRLAVINRLDREQLGLLHRLDVAFWAISSQIDVVILRYLEVHKDEVLAAEQS